MTAKSSLTVLFENPFWVGLYERMDGNKYEVCKITFGTEPKDYEVHGFLLKNWHKLKFSPPVKINGIREHKIDPKRMQREINSQLENKGIGTKAQQALKLQQEQGKILRKAKSREQRDAEEQYQFALRQEKKKGSTEESRISKNKPHTVQPLRDFSVAFLRLSSSFFFFPYAL